MTQEPQLSLDNGDQPYPLRLIAYRTKGIGMALVPAKADRPWMTAGKTTFANRCLPMRIANQHGWFVLNPSSITITWNGGVGQRDLKVESSDGRPIAAMSHFGHGVLTWWLPYLFRTPAGYNMHVRGPVNFCKDGIIALDAIVETDWAVASFPMSWRVTRIGMPIRFEEGEPICMISPIPRSMLERCEPVVKSLDDAPSLQAKFQTWSASRKKHNNSLRDPAAPRTWEKHYFLGTHPGTSEHFTEHQIRLRVKPFSDPTATPDENLQSTPETGCTSTLSKRQASTTCPFHSLDQNSRSNICFRVIRSFLPNSSEIEHFLRSTRLQRRDSKIDLWRVDEDTAQTGILSANVHDAFPPDLCDLIHSRLAIWSSENQLGKLESCQLSLVMRSSGRNNVLLNDNSTYFILPLAIHRDWPLGINFWVHRKKANVFGRRKRIARIHANDFLAIPGGERISFRPVHFRKGGYAIVLEGTYIP